MLKNISIKSINKILGFCKKNDIDLSIGECKKNNSFFLGLKKDFSLMKYYPNAKGLNKLKKSIKKWIFNKYSLDISKGCISPSLGNREGLFTSFLYFNDNNKNFIGLLKPYYPIYFYLSKLFNKKIVFINNLKNIKNIKHKINIVILNSPNNPNGKIINKNFIKKLVHISRKYNIKIISDECYSEVCFYKSFCSLIPFCKNLKNIIVLDSLSKRSCLPGLRSGFIFSHKSNISKIVTLKNISGTVQSNFIQSISSKLWSNFEHSKSIFRLHKKKMIFCFKVLKRNRLIIKFPYGTFYFWINIFNTGKTDFYLCKDIYKKYRIRLMPGSFFGNKNYLRIAMVEDFKTCLKAIKIISKYLSCLIKKK